MDGLPYAHQQHQQPMQFNNQQYAGDRLNIPGLPPQRDIGYQQFEPSMMNNIEFSDRVARESDRFVLDMADLEMSSIQKQPGDYERED